MPLAKSSSAIASASRFSLALQVFDRASSSLAKMSTSARMLLAESRWMRFVAWWNASPRIGHADECGCRGSLGRNPRGLAGHDHASATLGECDKARFSLGGLSIPLDFDRAVDGLRQRLRLVVSGRTIMTNDSSGAVDECRIARRDSNRSLPEPRRSMSVAAGRRTEGPHPEPAPARCPRSCDGESSWQRDVRNRRIRGLPASERHAHGRDEIVAEPCDLRVHFESPRRRA